MSGWVSRGVDLGAHAMGLGVERLEKKRWLRESESRDLFYFFLLRIRRSSPITTTGTAIVENSGISTSSVTPK